MRIKLPNWFKRKPRKVILTGEDIINLRSDIDRIEGVLNKIVLPKGLTLREDVNDALSATVKALYKIEELEIRVTRNEQCIDDMLK